MSSSNAPEKEVALVLLFMGLVFGGVGYGGLFYATNLHKEAIRSAEWPTAPGVITYSGVKISTDDDGDTTYAPDVRFEYLLDGGTLTGNELTIAGSVYSSNRRPAEEEAAKWSVGQQVPVYMDPAKASRAVLVPGLEASAETILWLRIFFGLFALIGTGLLTGGTVTGINYFKERRRHRRERMP